MTLSAPTADRAPFHVMSVQGGAKSGKTHLACNNSPGKVAIQSTERGWDGVIQRLYPCPDVKQHPHNMDCYMGRFIKEDYFCPIDLSADELFAEGIEEKDAAKKEAAKKLADSQARNMNERVWKPFSSDYRGVLVQPDVRTIVWDFADEFNEYLRLANFGKLEKNPQMAYGPVNAEYKNLVRMAHMARKNLVMVHQVKQKYRTVQDEQGRDKSVPVEGVYERRGNDAADYLVHSFVETHSTDPVRNVKGEVVKPGAWYVKILRARLNPEVNGLVLESPDWPLLMSFLAPEIPGEAWL